MSAILAGFTSHFIVKTLLSGEAFYFRALAIDFDSERIFQMTKKSIDCKKAFELNKWKDNDEIQNPKMVFPMGYFS